MADPTANKTNPINTANPAGGSDPRDGDNCIRALAEAVAEILAVDHYVGASSPYNSARAGMHTRVKFQAGYSGDSVSGCLFVSGDHSVGGSLEFTNFSGDRFVLTSGDMKVLNKSLLSHTGSIASTAGTDLIKCSGEVCIIASGSLLASAADPPSNAGIACKKYVDDQIDAHANTTPDTVSSGGFTETPIADTYTKVVYPNGEIHVKGYMQGVESSNYEETLNLVPFGFNALTGVQVTGLMTAGNTGGPVYVTAITESGGKPATLKVSNTSGVNNYTGFFYDLWGY